jgi:hypothetical protein
LIFEDYRGLVLAGKYLCMLATLVSFKLL